MAKKQSHVCSYIRLSQIRAQVASGLDQPQAEGMTKAMRTAIDKTELATRKDLQIELAPVHADLNLLKWMMGVLIAITVANFARQFF